MLIRHANDSYCSNDVRRIPWVRRVFCSLLYSHELLFCVREEPYGLSPALSLSLSLGAVRSFDPACHGSIRRSILRSGE